MFNRKAKRRKQVTERWGRRRTEPTSLDLAAVYHELKPRPDSPYLLNEQTREDLDFDAFYRFVDHGWSAIGQQALYARLVDPAPHPGTLEEDIAALTTDERLRTDLCLELDRMNKIEDYYLPNDYVI